MRNAIDETRRRREIQAEYNTEHGITPTTIVKSIAATLVTAYEGGTTSRYRLIWMVSKSIRLSG